MLTPEQIAHFETFGFLFMRQVFSSEEIEKITLEAEILWEENRRSEAVSKNGISMDAFVERSPLLTELVDDDRIFHSVEQLLGSDFVWVGSEGNVTKNADHRWHSDRKCWRKEEEEDITYRRIKIMLYLDPVTKDTGCLFIRNWEPKKRMLNLSHLAHWEKIYPVILWNQNRVTSYYLITASFTAYTEDGMDDASSP